MATKATTMFSLDAVKAYLAVTGAGSDDLLTRVADAASERVEAYTSRLFVTRSVTEVVDGTGRSSLRLRHFPVVAVQEVKLRYSLLDAWTSVDVAIETVLDPRGGLLYLTGLHFPKGPLSTTVTYTAGFGAQDAATLPADVVQAGLELAKYIYDRKTSGATMASQITMGPTSASIIPDMPADVKAALAAHRKIRTAFVR